MGIDVARRRVTAPWNEANAPRLSLRCPSRQGARRSQRGAIARNVGVEAGHGWCITPIRVVPNERCCFVNSLEEGSS